MINNNYVPLYRIPKNKIEKILGEGEHFFYMSTFLKLIVVSPKKEGEIEKLAIN